MGLFFEESPRAIDSVENAIDGALAAPSIADEGERRSEARRRAIPYDRPGGTLGNGTGTDLGDDIPLNRA